MKKFTFYVSPDGCDKNAGDAASPFKTIERAQSAAREAGTGAEIILGEGEYFTRGLELDRRDNGISYKASGKVVLTGGITIPPEDFMEPSDEVKMRFREEVRSCIKRINLTKYGFTPADWGDVYATGAYHTAAKYDNGKIGVNMEVFSNNRRMKLARYPNGNDFLRIDAVADVGDVAEFPPQNYYRDWGSRRNHRGGIYVMDRGTNERVKGWKNPETAWMFGYLYWDWADSSTPVTFNTENRLIYPEYVSHYACRSGALYYFFNVLEELDEPGEWYLDRETGDLYFYPYDNGEGSLDISISTKPIISGENVCGVTLEGFALKCTRGDGIVLSGESNDNIIRGITVTNIAGNAIEVSGYRNLVEKCDISHTGKGGIHVTGGDRASLTPGENFVTNNYIHDFSEVYLTYQSGVSIHGVGNVCSHNEISGSPHMAIGYSGNDQIIEYNYIHEVVLQSSDAGAVYSGYNWTAQGCVMRYNLLENIGAGKFTPDGIYWDDGLSGQKAYGNILINVKKYSFLVGGGRDCEVFDNVIINAGNRPVMYDDRNRDGFVHDGWARASCNTPDSPHWVGLREMPYTSEKWAAKYPTLAKVKTDFTEYDDPDFPINPSYSVIRNNIIIDPEEKPVWCAESVYRYSTVENNPVYKTAEEAGFDLEAKKFVPEREGFPQIPVEKIGRY